MAQDDDILYVSTVRVVDERKKEKKLSEQEKTCRRYLADMKFKMQS